MYSNDNFQKVLRRHNKRNKQRDRKLRKKYLSQQRAQQRKIKYQFYQFLEEANYG